MFTGADRHQGCVAFVSPIQYHKLEDVVLGLFERGESPLLLFPAGVTDIRNFGSIARTAECMGVHAILMPTTHSARVNADALKTSAGALFHLPVCRVPGYGPALDYLKHSGFQIIGCYEKGEFPLRQLSFTTPTCLIIGGEAEGIPEAVLAKCDATCRIPMQGQVGSLNVAVATGMLLYEAQRQRNT
jgi:23S rRNA (guanosine2251-2'-O)-methyltransferase